MEMFKKLVCEDKWNDECKKIYDRKIVEGVKNFSDGC